LGVSVKLIIAAVFGAVLAMSSERLANKSDPGVATETIQTQDSIMIEAPSRPQTPLFDFTPAEEQ
jgi:hypothetical protein